MTLGLGANGSHFPANLSLKARPLTISLPCSWQHRFWASDVFFTHIISRPQVHSPRRSKMGDSYQEDGKLLQKMKQYPAVPIGLVTLVGIVTYNIYKFKKRGNTSPSVYIIHTRLAGQGAVVGCLALTVVYTLGQKLWARFNKDK